MPAQQHYFGAHHLHHLTKNTYRRVRVFDSDRFKLNFTRTLDDLRGDLGFKTIGYVLIPQGESATSSFGLPSLLTRLRSSSGCKTVRQSSS